MKPQQAEHCFVCDAIVAADGFETISDRHLCRDCLQDLDEIFGAPHRKAAKRLQARVRKLEKTLMESGA